MSFSESPQTFRTHALGMAPLSDPAADTAQTLTANGYVGIGVGATKKLARALAVRQAHREGDGSAQSFNHNDLVLSLLSLSNHEDEAGRAHGAIPGLDKYSPDQPRVPAGQSDGGQWTSGASAGASTQSPKHTSVGRSSLLDDGVYRPDKDGAPRLTPVGSEEDEGEKDFTEPRIINGRVFDVTPEQSGRYDASLKSANLWTAQVRSSDPNWAPRLAADMQRALEPVLWE